MQPFIVSRCLAALLFALLAVSGTSFAVTATHADLWSTADCSAHADLDVGWTGAGPHFEYGSATDKNGSTIGTFGPLNAENDSYSGRYQIPITTAQPSGSVIGSYGWVGANPPTPSTAVEFFVLYNCTTKVVMYRCEGAFGKCPNNARITLALLALPPVLPSPVPTLSAMATMALTLLLAGFAVAHLRRRPRTRPRRE